MHKPKCDPDPEQDQLSLLESKRLRNILMEIREELTAIRLSTNANTQLIEEGNKAMALRLDGIEAGVVNIENAGEAIMVAFNALANEIRSTPANQAAIDALATRVETKATKIKDAILANTDVDNDPDTNPPTTIPPVDPNVPPVTEAQLAQFKSQNPNATHAQLQQFRNRPR